MLNPEQLAAMRNSGTEGLLNLAGALFESADRLAKLNVATARQVLDGNGEYLRKLLGTQDVAGYMKLQAAQPGVAAERVAAYCQQVRGISGQSQLDFSVMVEAQLAEMNATIGAVLDRVSSVSPEGAGATVDAVKSAMVAANAAYDTLNRTVRQVADVAENQFQAVAEAAGKAVARSCEKVA